MWDSCFFGGATVNNLKQVSDTPACDTSLDRPRRSDIA
jgi:hypothetical protein